MTVLAFLRENARWVGGAFLMNYFTAFGQTYFISLSAGDIRAEYGLSHGDFGLIYMGATLLSAATLTRLGRIVDHRSVVQVVFLVMPLLALACLLMAFSQWIFLLFIALYMLRLFGQGMMSHIAVTAMGRWFNAMRGRAVSFSSLGLQTAEASFPLIFVAVSGLVGWRGSWVAAAALTLAVGLPLIIALMRVEREPQSAATGHKVQIAPRDWTRGEVLRDPLFWAILAVFLAPPFIGTTIFFHQVYMVELRGWTLEMFAGSFFLMSISSLAAMLATGVMVDRFSSVAVMPFMLLPIAAACLIIGVSGAEWTPFLFMPLIGCSMGASGTLNGSLWPELYGARHLGSIRAVVIAAIVFSTAVGPGLTGYLIDAGVFYPGQIAAMGLVSLALAVLMAGLRRRLLKRAGA
ncbi:MFS transporter [Martelella radicis]|uniref:Sugar phosphate permease n=1 Tax=Martelella radicis TaxID=1397476 RepID=A0A7W6KP47_9HYPH|nr:MFS transporter [Martelella radicis]MBB4123470.1 sugar phosphate permease [Martelella radicis]